VALLVLWAGYQWVPAVQYFVDRTVSLLAMGDFSALKMFILSFGWWAPVVSAGLMIFQTLAAPLPAFVLAIANAMAFGVFYGFLLSVGSALAAAYLAFYLSRWLGRPFVARWVRGKPVDSLIERYGAWGIFLLRLFPVVSFDFVSFAAGLTVIRPLPFGLATLLGMMPAALAFSMLGESIESANRWTFIGGVFLFVILIIFSLIMRRTGVMKR
jgi:uncharacterized membrane protein YdjX (TVP38/TMEM64 family)